MSALGLVRVGPDALAERVAQLAGEISADHPEGVLLVGVLKGSVCLLADLARHLEVACELDFLALSAYAPGARRVRIVKDLDGDVAGRDVVIVTDVVDTGFSLHYLTQLLERRRARSVRICTLIERPNRRIVPLEVRYVGFSFDDAYLVGYGLDCAEGYRNLRGLVEVDPRELIGSPSAAASLYPLFKR